MFSPVHYRSSHPISLTLLLATLPPPRHLQPLHPLLPAIYHHRAASNYYFQCFMPSATIAPLPTSTSGVSSPLPLSRHFELLFSVFVAIYHHRASSNYYFWCLVPSATIAPLPTTTYATTSTCYHHPTSNH